MLVSKVHMSEYFKLAFPFCFDILPKPVAYAQPVGTE
jgi:hypothetical protein